MNTLHKVKNQKGNAIHDYWGPVARLSLWKNLAGDELIRVRLLNVEEETVRYCAPESLDN